MEKNSGCLLIKDMSIYPITCKKLKKLIGGIVAKAHKNEMADRLGEKQRLLDSQAAQAHVSRKSQRLIPERVTRCVTRC